MSAAPKPSFPAGGEFLAETRRDVERYLASPQARARGRALLYAKGGVAFGLVAASWLVLVLARPGPLAGVAALAALVLGMIQVGFCVQHDANHGAYFRSRRLNHLLGWSTDAVLGFSSYVWRVKHNVAHHTYTNVDGWDDDISQTPFLRLLPTQPPRPWYRLQHLYVWPLYAVMFFRAQTGGDIAAFWRGRVGNSAVHPPRGWDLVGLVAGKALFVAWALVVPLLVYPWWLVLGGYAAATAVGSLIVATTFQLAHCVEEADALAPAEVAARARPWAVHEVETTVDFCQRNRVLTWFLGGLNFQIEHHLFPRVPHTHYPRIAEIVRRSAVRHGVRYCAHDTLRGALRSHTRHVRALGRRGLPVELEMG